jgi:hypothetical protein
MASRNSKTCAGPGARKRPLLNTASFLRAVGDRRRHFRSAGGQDSDKENKKQSLVTFTACIHDTECTVFVTPTVECTRGCFDRARALLLPHAFSYVQNVVTACKQQGVARLVYVSSYNAVFDGRTPLINVDEDTATYVTRETTNAAYSV